MDHKIRSVNQKQRGMRGRILGTLLFLLLLPACETDQSKPKEDLGEFWLGEFGYSVSGAFFISRLDADSVPIVTLSLYSGFEYRPESSTIGQITGIGNVLEISCRSSEPEKLHPAYYNFSPANDPFTVKQSVLKLAYKVSTQNSDSVVFNQGNIAITGEGENKHLIYFFKAPGGAELSGYYDGPIRFYKLRSDQM